MGKNIQFDKIIEFELYLKNEEKSIATIEKYIRDVKCFAKVLDFLSLLRDGKFKQHMKNRCLCFKMLQLFIRILDYPVAK